MNRIASSCHKSLCMPHATRDTILRPITIHWATTTPFSTQPAACPCSIWVNNFSTSTLFREILRETLNQNTHKSTSHKNKNILTNAIFAWPKYCKYRQDTYPGTTSRNFWNDTNFLMRFPSLIPALKQCNLFILSSLIKWVPLSILSKLFCNIAV